MSDEKDHPKVAPDESATTTHNDTAFGDVLRGLAGSNVPLCDSCNAIGGLTEVATSVFRLNIAHDEWCPVLAFHERRGKR